MIIWNLQYTLDRKDMSQRELERLTNIRRGTIRAYCHGSADYIGVEHINSICKVLNCDTKDIFEFIPDEKLDKDKIF